MSDKTFAEALEETNTIMDMLDGLCQFFEIKNKNNKLIARIKEIIK